MALPRRVSAEDEIQLFKLIIASTFLLSLPVRFWCLQRLSPKASAGAFGVFKAILALLLPIYQGLRLVEHHGWPSDRGFVNAATPIAGLIVACGYWVLSLIEHKRSSRPSTPIILFLCANLVCDIAEYSLVSGNPTRSIVAVTAPLLDLLLLIVESRDKHSTVTSSPEEGASVLSRAFFWWINPILATGYRKTLEDGDIPNLDLILSSASLRQISIKNWEKRRVPETPTTLPRVLLRILLKPFLLVVPARIFLIVFRYSQPLLIQEAIRYLGEAHGEQEFIGNFNIISVAVIIYIGLAVSGAAYQHCLNRLTVMIRGVLVSLIHHKTLNTASNTLSEGKVVTLMSNDVDSLSGVASMFHETWAQIVEVVIGIIILASKVGWLWPLPLVLIFFCSRVSQYVARNLRSRQGAWNSATQDRLSMTSAVLSTIKNIKMLGLQSTLTLYIERLRRTEINTAARVRWMMVVYNASANALGIFTPAITLVLYALIAKSQGYRLDAEAAFTAAAVLGLITHPANMVMTIVPRAVASFSSFERIQKFLLEPDLVDSRLENISSAESTVNSVQERPALSFRQVMIKSTSSKVLLKDLTFDVLQGSLVICAGPTASGKTTLAKAILGELPASCGTISVASKHIGYCAQAAWLPSTTIKQAILSFSRSQEVDNDWYAEVLRICCLQSDLDDLPSRDETLIGSRGMNLSGGQRQRVALARALYARPEILLLDDTLSGLDGNTENDIVENLFGSNGVVRKMGMTTFLITNAAQYFQLADRVLLLDESVIKEQGRCDELQSKQQRIEKIISKATTFDETVKTDQPPPKSSRRQNNSAMQKNMDQSRPDGDSALYGYYVRSAGYGNFSLLVTCTASYSLFVILPQYWLKLWTDSESGTTWFFAAGYVMITLLAWIATNGIMWTTVMRVAPHSGLKLHSKLLNTIMMAPLSHFSSTETGEILNRFSQDIQLVDKQLANAMQGLFVQIFKLTVQVVFLFIASKYMTLTLPFCCAVVYIVQKVYLRTSRQLRLRELDSRSTVFSNFLETVEGVTTIRAFQADTKAEVEHLVQLDISQKPYYLLFCLQRWLKIVLDLLVAAIGIGVIVLAVTLKGTTRGSQIGLALNIVLIVNTTLLSLVTSWTNLEISLGAISRLKSLEETTVTEDSGMDTPESYISKPWPEPGTVEMDNVTAAYNPNAVALQNFSLRVEPGQLLVLCGRTGKGKSSVLLSLLKMIDVKEGSIRVHGLHTMHAPVSVIRENFFVTIPQDATLFNHATLRFNVDPSESFGNDTIKEILQRMQLLHHFEIQASDHAENAGEQDQSNKTIEKVLNTDLSSLPQLSAGQAQLVAVGRALLQARHIADSGYKPIILLDEATSSLDTDTERVILSVIRDEFIENGYTVIMVAHRLGAVKEIMRQGVDKMIEM